LGLVIYEALTGEKPFSNATTPNELIACHLINPLPAVHQICQGLPPALDAVIQTATAKLPEHRYGDVLRMAAAFRAAIPSPDHHARHQPLVDPLTEREIEILSLLQESLTNGEIAARLVLSLGTIKWYLRQIFTKLDVHDRYKAVEHAVQLGLIGTPRQAEIAITPLAPIAIEPTAIEAKAPAKDVKNPFKGLHAYEEADAADFFGREALTQTLVARLASAGDTARFLAVVGPSGSGKSSVVRAGLIPALRHEALPGSSHWFIVEMLPGAHPMEELEAALLRIAVNPPESLLNQLREDDRGLARAIKRVLPVDDSQLLLVIDQFEEIFTLIEDETARAHFLNSLYIAVTELHGRLWVILTLRADFYDRPLLYEHFAALMQARTEVIVPLSADELSQAIVQPAARVGVTVEANLIAVIVKDLGEQPGALPLLQFALTELFERREGRTMSLAAYRANGGVLGTLARRADELYNALSPAAQELAHQLFLRLVTPGEGMEDTRRRVLVAEMVTLPGSERVVDEVFDTFGQHRLLTFDCDPVTRGPTVEVAHEALIRNWGRLRSWLNTSREALYVERRMLTAATEWARAGHDPSFLASGARLAQFETLAVHADIALNEDEKAYLAASTAERERHEAAERAQQAHKLTLERRAANRLRYLAAVLTLFLLVTIGLSAVTLTSRAELAANLTRSEAERLGLESINMHQGLSPNQELMALLAIRAVRTQYTPYGDAALTAAAQLDYPLKLQLGPGFHVFDANFSTDGRYILTANIRPGETISQVWLWDTGTRSRIRQFIGHTNIVNMATFSPDGKYVVTTAYDNTVRLWNVETGTEWRRFTVDPDRVWQAVISKDTGALAAVGALKTGEIVIWWWDPQSAAELRRLTLPVTDSDSLFAQLSPDNKLLALTPGDGKALELWDAQTGLIIRRFEGVVPSVSDIAFSPDYKYLLTGGRDYIARLWDVQTGTQLHEFVGHQDFIRGLAFSPDGSYVLTGGVAGDKTIRQWDIKTGQQIHKWDIPWLLFKIQFSPDGQSVIIAGDDGVTAILPLDPPTKPRILNHPDKVRNVAYSPDGRYILTAGGDSVARLWDAQTGQEVRRFVGHTERVTFVLFSPDGKLVLTTSTDCTYRLWNTQTGETVRILRISSRSGGRYAGAFSPDGRYLLLTDLEGDVGNSVVIWDLQTDKEVHRFLATWLNLYCAWFSPDGRYVLSSGDGGNVILWDAQTGTKVRQFSKDAEVDGGRCGAFSPDGRYVFVGSGDGIGRLYKTDTGEVVQRFVGHSSLIVFVAYSPDGRYVATTSGDSTARLWDAQTGKELRRFTGHTGTLWGVAFSPDGKYVVTGGWTDNTARVWSTDINSLMLSLCARLTRDFTDTEREQYRIPDKDPTCPQSSESVPPTWTAIPTSSRTSGIPVWQPTVSATP